MGKFLLVSAVFCAVVAFASAEELKSIEPTTVFELIDSNKNGVVCIDELMNYLKANSHTVEREDVARLMRAVDFNKNGTLEKPEVEQLFKFRNQFIEYDTNKDQKLTKEELKKFFEGISELAFPVQQLLNQRLHHQMHQGSVISEKDQKELLEEVDEDGDGSIDFDEFVFLAAILKDFMEFDKDNDKKISDAELKKFLRDSSAKVTASDVLRMTLAADDDDNKEIDIDEFAKIFLVLDAFRATDANRSGHLDKTKVEAYLKKVKIDMKSEDLPRLMKIVDEDNNGLVDLDEYTFIYASVQNFKKHLKEKKTELEKPEVKAFLEKVKLQVSDTDLDELISVLDEDKNQTIDFDEFVELFHVYKYFKHVDDNGDKNISQLELAKFFSLFNTKISTKDIARLAMIADEDHNKKVDVDEFARIYLIFTNFRASDKDSSSHLNAKELEAYLTSISVKGATGEALAALVRVADEDSNDLIDVDEFAFIYIAAHAFNKHDDKSGALNKQDTEKYFKAIKFTVSEENFKELIENLDKNGDSMLDFPEFTQLVHVVKYFRNADSNSDGDISDDEAETFLDGQETKISATDLQRLKVAVDDDNNGKIDIDEFAKVVLIISAFKAYDKDNSQCLSKAEAKDFLREVNINVGDDILELLFKIVDEDTNGTLDIDEFSFVYVAHMAFRVPAKSGKILKVDIEKYLVAQKFTVNADDYNKAIIALEARGDDLEFHEFTELVQAVKMFKSIDTNNDKIITKAEAQQVATKLGQTWEGKKVSDRFDTADLDRDGNINLPEFVSFFHVKRTAAAAA